MSQEQRTILWPVLALTILSLGTWAWISGHSREHPDKKPKVLTDRIPRPRPAGSEQSKKDKVPTARNLSLQPEAFNMGLKLGQRFAASKREKSVVMGTVTIGSDRRTVQTIRTQTDDGEQVEIKIAGSQSSLTWDRGQGFLSSNSRASGADRDLIERLVLDSPDQFVLGQLRGASYYTVATNVRPADAGDKYAGPLWNIVRMGDPEPDESKSPQSRWRLYYLNVTTGLIDRVVSEVSGQRITAQFSAWTELNGEKIPTHIQWTVDRQILMQYDVTNFSHAEK